MAATSLSQGRVVSQVPSSFPECFHACSASLHFHDSLLLHPPLCILDSLQDPSLRRLGFAFVGHGGLFSSTYLSSKMLPYGRIFLKVSNVVNSLKPQLYEDSWLFHYGSQMRKFCCLWFLGMASLVGILCEATQGGFSGGARTGSLISIQGTPSTRLSGRCALEGNPETWRTPNLTDWAEEKVPPKHTTKPPKQSRKQNRERVAHNGGEKPGWAVSRESKGNSFQKDWVMVFNAVQQPRKKRTAHHPLVTADCNKGLLQGSSEGRSQTWTRRRWQRDKDEQLATVTRFNSQGEEKVAVSGEMWGTGRELYDEKELSAMTSDEIRLIRDHKRGRSCHCGRERGSLLGGGQIQVASRGGPWGGLLWHCDQGRG